MGQFLDIAATVMRRHGRPMKPREIVDNAKDDGLFSDKLAGKTPEQTMKAKISVNIRTKGPGSIFVRTAPNTFFLRELLPDPSNAYDAPPQSPPSRSELVIVFPTNLLNNYGRFQGVSRKWRPFLQEALSDSVCKPMARLEAEQSEASKQLLTYVLVTRKNRILCFRRGTFNRVEDYLRGSLCIGFGGHVSEGDRTLYNRNNYRKIVLESAARELSEELRLPEADRRRLSDGTGLHVIGLLNDDSSPTGRKHLAVVLNYEASAARQWDTILRGEKSITQLGWISLTHFRLELRDFEYWSQLCLAEFFTNAIRTQPSYVIRRRAPFRRKHILCIIGGIGSGKSAATEILTREFGYAEVNSGRVVAELLGVAPVPKTRRESFQQKAWEFIQGRGGPRRLASALLRAAEELEGPALIDGIRQRATLEALRRMAAPKSVAILYINTPPHIAFSFYRDRKSQPAEISEFLKLCDAPVELEAKKLITIADAVLYNWTGKLRYEQAVRGLMKELHE